MMGLLGIVAVSQNPEVWVTATGTALLIVAVERVLAAAERWRGRQ